MLFYTLIKKNGGVYIKEKEIDKALIKEWKCVDVTASNYKELCEEDIRYSMAHYVLTLEDGSKVFGR